jgi:chorismate-pyruvate lyase
MPAEVAVIPIDSKHSDLASLSRFFADEQTLGSFSEVAPADVPVDYRRLLDHHSHMTVALEESHQSPVDLRVLAVREVGSYYARKIALARRSDRRVVLFGLVRLNTGLLSPEAMQAIRQQTEPLGHVLIQHNVLREVERLRLWRIEPGPELHALFELSGEERLYGRTALIHCNSQPAIELLEIVHTQD